MNKVSVIIPTYRRAELLGDILNALVVQNNILEILVIVHQVLLIHYRFIPTRILRFLFLFFLLFLSPRPRPCCRPLAAYQLTASPASTRTTRLLASDMARARAFALPLLICKAL